MKIDFLLPGWLFCSETD